MKINLKRTNKDEGRMGHGVLFYFSISGPENKIPVAFLDGYRWLHAHPESVDVLLFALDQAKIAEIGRREDEVVNEVIEFVNKFLESKGRMKGQGKISTWWNA